MGTVERLSSTPGCKYSSVFAAAEFGSRIAVEFAHDVSPIGFGIRLTLGGGWAIERVCGSAELNGVSPGSTTIEISTEFASQLDAQGGVDGGIILLQLRAPPAAAPTTPARQVARSLARLAGRSIREPLQLPPAIRCRTTRGGAVSSSTIRSASTRAASVGASPRCRST